MFKENDLIALTSDVSGDEWKLKSGDVGTIVHVHPEGEAFVVEFMTFGGDTVDIATVLPQQMRLVTDKDVTHAKMVETAA